MTMFASSAARRAARTSGVSAGPRVEGIAARLRTTIGIDEKTRREREKLAAGGGRRGRRGRA